MSQHTASTPRITASVAKAMPACGLGERSLGTPGAWYSGGFDNLIGLPPG